jgi:hypothetical protein
MNFNIFTIKTQEALQNIIRKNSLSFQERVRPAPQCSYAGVRSSLRGYILEYLSDNKK